jgi:hypothetical protein
MSDECAVDEISGVGVVVAAGVGVVGPLQAAPKCSSSCGGSR